MLLLMLLLDDGWREQLLLSLSPSLPLSLPAARSRGALWWSQVTLGRALLEEKTRNNQIFKQTNTNKRML